MSASATAYPGWALQKAVYTRLAGHAATSGYRYAYNGRPAYPYTMIGQVTVAGDYNKTNAGAEATMTLHTWGRPDADTVDVKEIMAANDYALRSSTLDLSADGFTALAAPDLEFSETLSDFDAVQKHDLQHGVARYRFLIHASTQ